MIKVGIVGGTGYTGAELLRLLAAHPYAQLQAVTSRKAVGIPITEIHPSLRGRISLAFLALEEARLSECDVVFFSTPNGVAMTQAPELLKASVRLIDLAADFRQQDTAVFEKWYNLKHSCPELLKEAIYGLPELNRSAIKSARIIGNPGCYPTTIQLGLAPLLKADVVDAAHLIADCKSGISGGGRKREIGMLFSEASDNFKAYGVSGHRHSSETVEQLNKLTNKKIGLLFAPHLVPMIRGMHSTLYARLTKDIDNVVLQTLFEDFYKDEPFIDVMPFGAYPETRSTRASNILRIALHRPVDGDTLVVLVVQDNLVKGSAGQAVQCMNLMFNLEETIGLLHMPVMP